VNGIHDLGGIQGFGPIQREVNEPVFHEDWEGWVAAMNRALMALGVYSVDEMRHGIERMGVLPYLQSSYYERWLATIETNLIAKGLLTTEDVDARTTVVRDEPDASYPRRDDPELVARILEGWRGGTTAAVATSRPRFDVGDAVRTINEHPAGHTRLPRYARGKRGTISRYHGIATFPDTNAHGLGRQPQPLYGIRFSSEEIWGQSHDARAKLNLDLWESYLLPEEPGQSVSKIGDRKL